MEKMADMASGLLERLRGARRIELFLALALAALLALALLGARNDGGEGQKTALEARVERILGQIDGAGRVSAMITEAEDGSVVGVLIVADRLEDVGVYLRLQRAVAALLDIEAEKIEIMGRSGAFGGAI